MTGSPLIWPETWLLNSLGAIQVSFPTGLITITFMLKIVARTLRVIISPYAEPRTPSTYFWKVLISDLSLISAFTQSIHSFLFSLRWLATVFLIFLMLPKSLWYVCYLLLSRNAKYWQLPLPELGTRFKAYYSILGLISFRKCSYTSGISVCFCLLKNAFVASHFSSSFADFRMTF